MRICILTAMLLCASPLAAQEAPTQTQPETRTAPADHPSPSATLDQVEWLVGRWQGEGIGGKLAMESWLPRTGDTMVGTFVQVGDDGGIQFTEHLYLMEEAGTLVLRLKHFNADLTGWEERDDMLTFRLVEIADCAAYFRGLTLRCDGENGLLAAVRMSRRDGSTSELTFRMTRMD